MSTFIISSFIALGVMLIVAYTATAIVSFFYYGTKAFLIKIGIMKKR